MLKFIAKDPVGKGIHRSGWPYALRALKKHLGASPAGVLLDDYIERTFFYGRNDQLRSPHTEPWIGICHHPPSMPSWYARRGLRSLDDSACWRASLPSLRLLVTLAESSTRWAIKNWGKPCVTIRHPTAVPRLKWSISRYSSNPNKRLIQIGSYLRNTHAIYQLRPPDTLRKTRLVQSADWIDNAHKRCAVAFEHRPYVGDVDEIASLKGDDFDRLLSENVVFLELISAAASNTIVECIARNTPIVLNRLDGPEYYLGKQYPLFYYEIGEVESLLTDQKIASAHLYLKTLDKSWISGRAFAAAVESACKAYVPEFRTDRPASTAL